MKMNNGAIGASITYWIARLGGHPLIDRLLDDRITSAVTASPQYQAVAANAGFKQLAGLIKHYQDKYQVDFRGLCGKLLGGGVTLAISPNDSALLIVESEDAKTLNDVHEFLLLTARNEAQKHNDPDRVKSAEYRGVTGWSFAPKEAHAIIGNRLILANKPDALKALQKYSELLKSRVQDLNAVKETDLPRLNELLRKGHLQEIQLDSR